MAITVTDLLVRFSADTNDAAAGFDAMDQRVGRFGSMANSAFSSLQTVGTMALGAVGGGLLALGGGMVGTAVSGLSLNSTMESVTAQLNAFTKDGAKSAEILNMIRERAAKTPFEFNEMAAAAAGLLPASKASGQGLESLIEKAEILAASNPAEGLEGAAFALREAVSGDFTSIIERFNLPRAYINQLKAEGVPALEIVSRAMKEVGFDTDLVSNLAETAAGRWSTFKDTFQTFAATMTQPIFDRFSAGLGSVNGWLEANAPLLSHASELIGNALGAALDAIGARMPSLDSMLGGLVNGFVNVVEIVSGVIQVFSEFSSSGELLSAAEFGIGEQAAATADRIVDFALAIYDGISAVMTFISPIVNAIASFVSWQDVLIAVGLSIAAVVVPAIAAFVAAWAPVIATVAVVIGAVALLRNAWQSNFLGIQTITVAAGNAVSSIFASVVEWLSPLPSILADLQSAFEWIWEGQGGDIDWWWDITDGFVQMGIIGQETGDRLADVLFNLGSYASGAIQAFRTLASGQDVQTLQSNVLAAFGEIGQAISDFFSGEISLGGLASAVATGFGDILGALSGFFGGGDWSSFLETIQWDQFISVLTWENFVSVLDWAGSVLALVWSDYVGPFLWNSWLTLLDWGSYILSLPWGDYISGALDWAAYVGSFLWSDYIAPLLWDGLIAVLDWAQWLTTLDWTSIITTVIDWATWIPALTWTAFVTLLEWGTYIAGALVWGTYVTVVALADFVTSLSWSDFVAVLDWVGYIVSFTWESFVEKLEWTGFVSKMASWGDYIVAVDWTSFIVETLKWGLYVVALAWNTFVTLIEWADWLVSLSWDDYAEMLRWDDYANPFEWSTFIKNLAWSDWIGKSLAWADFVASLIWTDFVSKLTWPDVSFSWSNFVSHLSWPSISFPGWSSFIPSFPGWPNISGMISGLIGGGDSGSTESGGSSSGGGSKSGSRSTIGMREQQSSSGVNVATLAAAIAEAMQSQPLVVNLAFNATITGEADAQQVSYQMARRISDIIQRRAT